MVPSPTPKSLQLLLGHAPAAEPLESRVLEVVELDTHTRMLLEYSTVGNERVQAFLLRPSAPLRGLPGILAIHQDGGRRPYAFGKSESAGEGGDPDLAYGLELCQRGYVVICPDRVG